MEFKTALAVITYAIVALFALTFLAVVVKIFTNTIDLRLLLSEPDGSKASLSRFQLFIFTMVVAGLYLVLSIENGQLLDIPNGVLALLGISGGSFLVSKGISSNDSSTPPKIVRKNRWPI